MSALSIRARTKAALAVKRGRGERVGQIPFGYELGNNGSHLEANREEQEVIALICGASRGRTDHRRHRQEAQSGPPAGQGKPLARDDGVSLAPTRELTVTRKRKVVDLARARRVRTALDGSRHCLR